MIIAHHAATDAQDHWPVAANQRGKRGLVARGEKTSQQLAVGQANARLLKPRKRLYHLGRHRLLLAPPTMNPLEYVRASVTSRISSRTQREHGWDRSARIVTVKIRPIRVLFVSQCVDRVLARRLPDGFRTRRIRRCMARGNGGTPKGRWQSRDRPARPAATINTTAPPGKPHWFTKGPLPLPCSVPLLRRRAGVGRGPSSRPCRSLR